jgi:hypothetical protein
MNGCQRGCITDVGEFDAGQARNVKPHIDLMLKLHKKLNKDCPARANAEKRYDDAEIGVKPQCAAMQC